MLTKTPDKNAIIFECKMCDFISSKESEYKRHVMTSKHNLLTKMEIVNKNAKIFDCKLCSNDICQELVYGSMRKNVTNI